MVRINIQHFEGVPPTSRNRFDVHLTLSLVPNHQARAHETVGTRTRSSNLGIGLYQQALQPTLGRRKRSGEEKDLPKMGAQQLAAAPRKAGRYTLDTVNRGNSCSDSCLILHPLSYREDKHQHVHSH